MGKTFSIGEMAYAVGKVHNMLLKVEKALDELNISSQQIDQSISILIHACENKINILKDRPQ